MKTAYKNSIYFSIALLLSFLISFTSCTKETIRIETRVEIDTLIIKDTVVIKDTAVSLALLTGTSWKVQEIRGVTANTILYYQRGGTTNTNNFDNEYITFNADKTGIYYDGDGYLHQLTWDFLNTEMTKLAFTITNPAPFSSQTVVYDNLRYKNKALRFDQYWTMNSTNHHAQSVRIPR